MSQEINHETLADILETMILNSIDSSGPIRAFLRDHRDIAMQVIDARHLDAAAGTFENPTVEKVLGMMCDVMSHRPDAKDTFAEVAQNALGYDTPYAAQFLWKMAGRSDDLMKFFYRSFRADEARIGPNKRNAAYYREIHALKVA